jgi:hypothetical protein
MLTDIDTWVLNTRIREYLRDFFDTDDGARHSSPPSSPDTARPCAG